MRGYGRAPETASIHELAHCFGLVERVDGFGEIAGSAARRLRRAVGIAFVVLASRFAWFATGAALLGIGTAMVYPTLLAAIGDVAHPSWRASSVGVYRLWRDLGYAIGALLAGVIATRLASRPRCGPSPASRSRRVVSSRCA